VELVGKTLPASEYAVFPYEGPLAGRNDNINDACAKRTRLRLFQCGGSADGASGSLIGGICENTAAKKNGALPPELPPELPP